MVPVTSGPAGDGIITTWGIRPQDQRQLFLAYPGASTGVSCSIPLALSSLMRVLMGEVSPTVCCPQTESARLANTATLDNQFFVILHVTIKEAMAGLPKVREKKKN